MALTLIDTCSCLSRQVLRPQQGGSGGGGVATLQGLVTCCWPTGKYLGLNSSLGGTCVSLFICEEHYGWIDVKYFTTFYKYYHWSRTSLVLSGNRRMNPES